MEIMDAQRSDAARNRDRILKTARAFVDRGEPLSFNAVARAANTGVGTVYRHFETVEILEEVLVWDRFDDLAAMIDGVTPETFDRLLEAYLGLLVSDGMFERTVARAATAHEHTLRLREGLVESLADVVKNAQDAGRLRRDVSAEDLLALLCGLAHSLRSLGISPATERARQLFAVVMRGVLVTST